MEKKHETMTGYSSAELSNMNFMDWFKGDAEGQQSVTRNLGKMMEKGFAETEALVQKKDGELIPAYFTASPLTINGKQYFTGVGIDSTEIKKRERALRTSEEKLQSILRVAPTGIGVVCNRILEHVNDRICQMTGYSYDELIGQNARILYPSDGDYEYVGTEKYKQIEDCGTGVSRLARKEYCWLTMKSLF